MTTETPYVADCPKCGDTGYVESHISGCHDFCDCKAGEEAEAHWESCQP